MTENIKVMEMENYINIDYKNTETNFSIQIYNLSIKDLFNKDPKHIFCFFNHDITRMVTFEDVTKGFKLVVGKDFLHILSHIF